MTVYELSLDFDAMNTDTFIKLTFIFSKKEWIDFSESEILSGKSISYCMFLSLMSFYNFEVSLVVHIRFSKVRLSSESISLSFIWGNGVSMGTLFSVFNKHLIERPSLLCLRLDGLLRNNVYDIVMNWWSSIIDQINFIYYI